MSAIIEQKISELNIPTEPERLYAPIRYALSGGGKRLRPLFLLLACDLFGGEPEAAADAAVAVEIFHNFTLLHDDIMDRAATRRNRPTVNARWDDNTAILSGDTMLIQAYRLLEKSDCLAELFPVFNTMSVSVCEGQQYDMDFEGMEPVDREAYFRMIRLKTAELIAGALKMGAVLGGASPEDRERAYDFGIAVGTAFQLQDDLLDSYGDPLTFGKRVGGDIVEGKKTYLVVRFRELASPEDRQRLDALFCDRAMDEKSKIRAVKELYDRYAVAEECRREIAALYDEAMLSLNKIQVADVRKGKLREAARRLVGRDR